MGWWGKKAVVLPEDIISHHMQFEYICIIKFVIIIRYFTVSSTFPKGIYIHNGQKT